MFKKAKKQPKKQRPVVYRPHLLYDDIEPDHLPIFRQAKARTSLRTSVDLLTVVLLGTVTAIVISLGNASSAQGHASIRPASSPRGLLGAMVVSHKDSTHKAQAEHNERPVEKLLIPLALLPPADPAGTACAGKTVMNIVAHEDDDLLFINPDITQELAQHDCVRTVYVTAGDDGRGPNYLHLREQGSEAAYDVMLGDQEPWIYQKFTLGSGAVVAMASPTGDADVSLVFLRLPDGNLDGRGFADTGHQSLARLRSGAITTIRSVDGQASYTSPQLTATLASLMDLYKPVRINTQADDSTVTIADHSDHIATGAYVTDAAKAYASQDKQSVAGLVYYYMGYPIRGLASDLTQTETQEKSAAFFAYAYDDPGVCTSAIQCADTGSSYGSYLSRRYVRSTY